MNTPPRLVESAGGVAIPAPRYAPEVVGTESVAIPPPMNTPGLNARSRLNADSVPVGVSAQAAVTITTATLAPRRMCLIAGSFQEGKRLAAGVRQCQN